MRKLNKVVYITLILIVLCATCIACDLSKDVSNQSISYSIQFEENEVSLNVGDKVDLPNIYVFKLENNVSSSVDVQCTFSISEEDILILNGDGKLVALKAGTTTLVAKYQNATAVLVVNVNDLSQGIIITFESNCEISSFTKEVTKDTVTLPSIEERKGYKFSGWQTQDGIKQAGDVISSPKESVTFTAVWTKITYTISYVLNGGTNNALNPSTYYVDTDTIILNYPSKEGFKFDGWYLDSNFTQRVSIIQKGSIGNIILYAKFVDKITASFVGGEGTTGNVSNIVLDSSNQITLPKNAYSKKGYNFIGWSDGKNTFNEGASYNLTTSTTFTALWQVVNYTITYNLNNGVNSKNNPSSYTINDENITLYNATKSGYEFKGWYLDSNFLYQISTIDTENAKNIEVYAKFETSYNVSFNANGGEGTLPESVGKCKNEVITLPKTTLTNIEGYFDGWSDGTNLYKPGDKYTITKDVEFKAQWLGNFEMGTELFDLANNEYIILYQNTKQAETAAQSLKSYIKQVLNVDASVTCDDNYSDFVYKTSKIISIGETSVFNSLEHFYINGNVADSDQLLKNEISPIDSFLIASDRFVICLISNSTSSMSYAVDQFIEDNLGVKFLTSDCTYIPQKTSAKLAAAYNAYKPLFEYRQYLNSSTYYPSSNDDITYANHMRFNGDYISLDTDSNGYFWYTDYSKGIGTAHNTLSFVNPSDYSDYEDTMFFKYNDTIIDICYTDGITSSGTIDRSTAAIDTAAEAMYNALYNLLSNTDKDNFWLSVGQADTNERCQCDDCTAATKKYNRSGITIRFWNAIINELESCGNESVQNKNYRFVMFAYQYNLVAPIVDNTIDSTCVPNEEHLWVRIAPIVMERYLALNDTNQPLIQRENGRLYDANTSLGHVPSSEVYTNWAKVTSNLFSWTYAPDFDNYFTYSGVLTNMKQNLTLLNKCNVSYVFIQGIYNEKNQVDQYLEAYVFSKLCWNIDADVTELRNEFLKYYYGDSAYENVKNYYDNFDTKYASNFSTSGTGSNGQGNVFNKLEDSFYVSQISLIDQAISASSSDYATRLEKLKLIPLFMLAKQNSSYRTQFTSLFETLGCTNISEGKTISDYTW